MKDTERGRLCLENGCSCNSFSRVLGIGMLSGRVKVVEGISVMFWSVLFIDSMLVSPVDWTCGGFCWACWSWSCCICRGCRLKPLSIASNWESLVVRCFSGEEAGEGDVEDEHGEEECWRRNCVMCLCGEGESEGSFEGIRSDIVSEGWVNYGCDANDWE